MARFNVQHPVTKEWRCFSTIVDDWITDWMDENTYQHWRELEYGRQAGELYTANMMNLDDAELKIERRKQFEKENSMRMDDLIYRRAAIDALGFGNEWEVMDFTVIDKDDAIHQIKALPSAQQWIPCSERLPRTKDDYIITVKDKYGTWTDYVEWSADYHWWGYDDDMVIAWMPLPEPYKGEET